jgi:hypothetical protein
VSAQPRYTSFDYRGGNLCDGNSGYKLASMFAAMFLDDV